MRANFTCIVRKKNSDFSGKFEILRKVIKRPKISRKSRERRVKSVEKFYLLREEVAKFFNLKDNSNLCLSRILPSKNQSNVEKSVIVFFDDIQPSKTYLIEGDPLKDPLKVSFSNSPLRTGLVYDKRMENHEDVSNETDIPEIPSRTARIISHLKCQKIYDKCIKVPSRIATNDELLLCHTNEYINNVNSHKSSKTFGQVYESKGTPLAAKLSCGSLLNMVDHVMDDKCDNGFVICRPPGHHALKDQAYGFCFFSNVAIAAKYAKKNYGLKKILIIDWDVHHGNGTQDLRMDEKGILYISIHRDIFPGTGGCNNIGSLGNTVNVNFLKPYGDAEILNAFYRIVMPISIEFKPQLILISAGFDAVIRDQLGRCWVQTETYGILTHILMNLCAGKRIILALEGGYNLSQLEKCVFECVRVLKGYPPKQMSGKVYKIDEMCAHDINKVIKIQSKYWNCFGSQKEICLERKDKNRNDMLNELTEELEKMSDIDISDDEDVENKDKKNDFDLDLEKDLEKDNQIKERSKYYIDVIIKILGGLLTLYLLYLIIGAQTTGMYK